MIYSLKQIDVTLSVSRMLDRLLIVYSTCNHSFINIDRVKPCFCPVSFGIIKEGQIKKTLDSYLFMIIPNRLQKHSKNIYSITTGTLAT